MPDIVSLKIDVIRPNYSNDMKKNYLSYIFFIGFIAVLIGSFLKIIKYNDASFILIMGIIANIIFIICAIREIIISKRITRHEKRMWFFGILFISCITAWIYILSARKRIVNIIA